MGIDLTLRGRPRAGWIRRGRVDLSTVAAWLRSECAAELESLDEDETPDGQPRLLAWLHPAAESVEILGLPDGEITVSARTTPTGPGYHFYVTRLFQKLGEEQRIDWMPADSTASYDDTGFFFGAGAGDVYLHMDRWLTTIAQLILERAEEGDRAFSLGMPLQTGFAQLDFANTPLGPRSREWVARVAAEGLEADTRVAADFFPWPREGQDRDYWFRRAMVQLWAQAVWRPVKDDGERRLLQRIDAGLAKAWALDPADSPASPGEEWPWREWRELREWGEIRSDLDGEIERRASAVAEDRPLSGFRRHEVVHRLMGGWSIRLPGSMAVRTEGRTWQALDTDRAVMLALFERAGPGSAAGGEVHWAYVEESLGHSARALLEEPAGEIELYQLHGLVEAGSQGATVTVVFGRAEELEWALGVWRSVRCLPARKSTV